MQAANQKNNLYYPETSKSVFHEPMFLLLVVGGQIYCVPGDSNAGPMLMNFGVGYPFMLPGEVKKI